jgi:hypothetical protein
LRFRLSKICVGIHPLVVRHAELLDQFPDDFGVLRASFPRTPRLGLDAGSCQHWNHVVVRSRRVLHVDASQKLLVNASVNERERNTERSGVMSAASIW